MPKSLMTHVMLGSDDVVRSKVFYDAILGAPGFVPGTDAGTHVYYVHGDEPALGIGTPFDRESATLGHGATVGFPAASNDAVDALHAAALAHGGTDEGAPGPQVLESGSTFGAYLRDPDANKVCAYATQCATPTDRK